MNTAEQTAKAFLTLYDALPAEVKQCIQARIIAPGTDRQQTSAAAKERKDRRKVLAERLKQDTTQLPADFKFNRDEANER
ncbi:MAG: AbrB family transcriptional regulator [Ferruginibacter sp.]|nr:AbrB family transcriptional regulator [Cytophagales bacterium]